MQVFRWQWKTVCIVLCLLQSTVGLEWRWSFFFSLNFQFHSILSFGIRSRLQEKPDSWGGSLTLDSPQQLYSYLPNVASDCHLIIIFIATEPLQLHYSARDCHRLTWNEMSHTNTHTQTHTHTRHELNILAVRCLLLNPVFWVHGCPYLQRDRSQAHVRISKSAS